MNKQQAKQFQDTRRRIVVQLKASAERLARLVDLAAPEVVIEAERMVLMKRMILMPVHTESQILRLEHTVADSAEDVQRALQSMRMNMLEKNFEQIINMRILFKEQLYDVLDKMIDESLDKGIVP